MCWRCRKTVEFGVGVLEGVAGGPGDLRELVELVLGWHSMLLQLMNYLISRLVSTPKILVLIYDNM